MYSRFVATNHNNQRKSTKKFELENCYFLVTWVKSLNLNEKNSSEVFEVRLPKRKIGNLIARCNRVLKAYDSYHFSDFALKVFYENLPEGENDYLISFDDDYIQKVYECHNTAVELRNYLNKNKDKKPTLEFYCW